MYQYKLVGVFVLFLLFVGIRCQSGEEDRESVSETFVRPRPRPLSRWPSHDYWPSPDYHHGRSCDTETQLAISEVKSEIQDLQQLLVGLRQKLDPDFKLPPPYTESKCPPGFQYVNLARSCYKVVHEAHNWTSADQRCRDLHPEAHLVAIAKSEENVALKSYLRQDLAKNSHIDVCRIHSWGDGDKMLWTSAQRQNETSCADPFVWKISNETQLPLSFAYWDPQEPNCHDNKEQCVHMRPSRSFKWNDISCDRKLCPVCEFDLS